MNYRETHCKFRECRFCCIKKAISGVCNFLETYFITIFHMVVLVGLSWYVFKNWETCISMQFFDDFNGNNILFLVWIILIFLLIYKVDGSVIKLTEKKREQTQEDLMKLNLQYQIDTRFSQTKSSCPNLDNMPQNKERGKQNGFPD